MKEFISFPADELELLKLQRTSGMKNGQNPPSQKCLCSPSAQMQYLFHWLSIKSNSYEAQADL